MKIASVNQFGILNIQFNETMKTNFDVNLINMTNMVISIKGITQNS